MKHKHADLMMEYAKDAQETDKPGERWQYYDDYTNSWEDCPISFQFHVDYEYRRKPQEYEMTKEDWQRVVDEGFYVRSKFASKHTMFKGNQIDLATRSDLEVVREKGLRQPHFQGDKHPEGDESIVYMDTTSIYYENNVRKASEVNWNHVKEYIVLP